VPVIQLARTFHFEARPGAVPWRSISWGARSFPSPTFSYERGLAFGKARRPSARPSNRCWSRPGTSTCWSIGSWWL
jgi:hypothetical protein